MSAIRITDSSCCCSTHLSTATPIHPFSLMPFQFFITVQLQSTLRFPVLINDLQSEPQTHSTHSAHRQPSSNSLQFHPIPFHSNSIPFPSHSSPFHSIPSVRFQSILE